MWIWAICATIAAIGGVTAAVMLLCQARSARRRLQYRRAHGGNVPLSAATPFRSMNGLLDEVNALLDEHRAEQCAAQENEAALRETIVSLSHDIRTPLTSMDGYVQLLRQTQLSPQQAQYAQVIQARSAALRGMLDTLFTYAKLQNSGWQPELQPVSATQCVCDTLVSFYREFEAAGITPQVQLPTAPLTVNGNAEALRRVVQNVLKNTLEHGLAPVTVSLRQKNGAAEFCCANRVSQPEKIDTDKIFTRFYKADAARTHSSTGLGLAIAQGLVQRMGGSITAQVQADTFTLCFTLPLCGEA